MHAEERVNSSKRHMPSLVPTSPLITRNERQKFTGQIGAIVWFTGLSGSGKSTLGRSLEERLIKSGRCALVLDGDNLRQDLCFDLGFSASDRQRNTRRVAIVARLVAESGAVAIVTLISPLLSSRVEARSIAQGITFIEVHVATPLAECERRDPKGLYRRARAGDLKEMTGIDSPYEAPIQPDLCIDTTLINVETAVDIIVRKL